MATVIENKLLKESVLQGQSKIKRPTIDLVYLKLRKWGAVLNRLTEKINAPLQSKLTCLGSADGIHI